MFNEDDDYWGIIQFDDSDEEKFSVYTYLWLSEKLFLQGMCAFLSYAATQPQRSQLQLQNTQCVYNDILQLDFTKYKQATDEYVERIRF